MDTHESSGTRISIGIATCRREINRTLLSAHNKLLGWQSAEQSGTVTVTQVNKYLYFSARNLRLVPLGMHNQGDFKQPMALGFEGAVVAD